MRLTPNEIAYVLTQSRFPQEEWHTALSVALAESGGVTDAIGVNDRTVPVPDPLPKSWGSSDLGLFQINAFWHAPRLAKVNWRNPFDNCELACQIWQERRRTWTPWSVFNSGAYKKYANHATIGLTGPMPPKTWP